MNLSQSMLEGSTGKLNEVQQENLSQMVSVSRRLTNLINDILDFTKLKNGEITLDRRSISLQAAVQANYEVFRHIIANKPLQLLLRIPDHLPHVYVDENRLLQILYNLIGNAIKFTEQGEITVFAVQHGDFVEVTVKDTGIGIAEDKQDIIFHSFEQTGTAVSREYGGIW
jgi:two-component system sensor histidine kinase ChiS